MSAELGGVAQPASEQPFLYGGRFGVRSEPGAKLYHMHARYYDLLSGRFLTRDPIWPVLSEPVSLDPYQYAMDNPLSFIDPLGLEASQEGALIWTHDGWIRCGHACCNSSPYCRIYSCDHVGCVGHGGCVWRGGGNVNASNITYNPDYKPETVVTLSETPSWPVFTLEAPPRSKRVQMFINRVSTTRSGLTDEDRKDSNPSLPVYNAKMVLEESQEHAATPSPTTESDEEIYSDGGEEFWRALRWISMGLSHAKNGEEYSRWFRQSVDGYIDAPRNR